MKNRPYLNAKEKELPAFLIRKPLMQTMYIVKMFWLLTWNIFLFMTQN